MAIYTGSGTITDPINLDTGTTLATAVGGVTEVDHIFDIAAGQTITISGDITSNTNKLIKRGEGTLVMGANQGASMAGGYQLEAGTINPNGFWLSTYGGDAATSTPTANFIADFYDLRGGTLDFSTWTGVEQRLFSHADQGVTFTSGVTTIETNSADGGGDRTFYCHVTCNGGTLRLTRSDFNGDYNINGNLLGSRLIRDGDGDLRIRGTNNQLTHGIRILGGQVRLEQHLGPNPTSLVSDYYDLAGDFATQQPLSPGDQRQAVLRLRSWPSGWPSFPANQGWTVNGYARINLKEAANTTAQTAFNNEEYTIVNGPVTFADGTERYLYIDSSESVAGDSTSSFDAHIAFRGGVSGNASGDDSGFFINDLENYCYVHAQSDINLPNAVFSGELTSGSSRGGSLWVSRGGSARFRRLATRAWLQTDDDGSTDTNTISFDEAADNTIRQVTFRGTTNHFYFPLTYAIATADFTVASNASTGEIGGSFTLGGSLNSLVNADRRLFVDGTIRASRINYQSGYETIFTIRQDSVSLIDIDSSLEPGNSNAGDAIFSGDAIIRPLENMTYFEGGIIAQADVKNFDNFTYNIRVDDPNDFVDNMVVFSEGERTGDSVTDTPGHVTLASTLPTTQQYTLTSSATSIDEGQSVTFTLSTASGVADGTVVNYTTSGIVASDLAAGSSPLTGTLTTNTTTPPTLTYNLAVDSRVDTDTITVTIEDVTPARTFVMHATGGSGTINPRNFYIESIDGQTTYTGGIYNNVNFVDFQDSTDASDDFWEFLFANGDLFSGTINVTLEGGTRTGTVGPILDIADWSSNGFRANNTFGSATNADLWSGTSPEIRREIVSASVTVNDVVPPPATTANDGIVGDTTVIVSGIPSTFDLSAEYGTFGTITINTNIYQYDTAPVRQSDNTVVFTIRSAPAAWSIGDTVELDTTTPLYRVTFDNTNINEGGIITATLNTKNVADGTIPFTLNNNNEFFNLGTTEFNLVNGTATFEFITLLDGAERTASQEVTLTLTATSQEFTFNINNFSNPDNTDTFFGRQSNTIVGFFRSAQSRTSGSLNVILPRHLGGLAHYMQAIPQSGTLTLGENITATYTGFDEASSGSGDNEGSYRFTGVSTISSADLEALYGPRNTSTTVAYEGNIKTTTAVEINTNDGFGVNYPYGWTITNIGTQQTLSSTSEGFNTIDIVFPEGAYGRESGFRNIPQSGTLMIQRQDSSTIYTLTYDSWDTTRTFYSRPAGTVGGGPDRNEGLYATEGGRNPNDGYLYSARRFVLTPGQTIANDAWNAQSFVWFPNNNAINLNNVIVNSTNSGSADFEVGNNISYVSDGVYRLPITSNIGTGIEINDTITYNFVDDSSNYSRQGTVSAINNNNIDVNFSGFNIGTRNNLTISGFDGATHGHLNGEYTITTSIPTFTGFDPDGNENTPVSGSTVYSRTVGTNTFYVWNRADTNATQGGWHVSAEEAGDNTDTANPLNWAFLSLENPQTVDIENTGNWVQASGASIPSSGNGINTSENPGGTSADGTLSINTLFAGTGVTNASLGFTDGQVMSGVFQDGFNTYLIRGQYNAGSSVDAPTGAVVVVDRATLFDTNGNTVELADLPTGNTATGLFNIAIQWYPASLDPTDITTSATFTANTGAFSFLEFRHNISTNGTLSVNKINEGESVTFTVHTQGIVDGTNIPYTLSGAGVLATDFTSNSLEGEFTINNNVGTVTIETSTDTRTEGIETFTFNVGNNNSSVSIHRNTGSEVYTLTATDNLGNTITEANEGSTVNFELTTTNVPDETVINYSVSGIDSGDLEDGSSPMNGEFVIRSNAPISSTVIGRSGSTYFTRTRSYAFYDDGITDTDIQAIIPAGTGSVRFNEDGPWLPFSSVNYLSGTSSLTGFGDIRFNMTNNAGFNSQSDNDINQVVELTSTQARLFGNAQFTGTYNAWIGNTINFTSLVGLTQAELDTAFDGVDGIWVFNNSSDNNRRAYFARVISVARSYEGTATIRVDRNPPLNDDGTEVIFGTIADGNTNYSYIVEALQTPNTLRFNIAADVAETANETLTLTLNDGASDLTSSSITINNTSPEPVYTLTAMGIDRDGSTLSGDSFVVTEGGEVTYSLRSNTNNPTLFGDRIAYNIPSEINATDLTNTSDLLSGTFQLDNRGLGNTTWTTIGTLNDSGLGFGRMRINYNPGVTDATLENLFGLNAGDLVANSDNNVHGVIRVGSSTAIPFWRIRNGRTANGYDTDFRIGYEGRELSSLSRGHAAAGSIVQVATNVINVYGDVANADEPGTSPQGFTEEWWVGNSLAISLGGNIPFNSVSDFGQTQRNRSHAMANALAANPHILVYPSDRSMQPIAVTVSNPIIDTNGTDRHYIRVETNIPAPDDFGARSGASSNHVIQRVGTPADITLRFNDDTTFEGYENINFQLPNNPEISIPNIRVRDDGAVFNLTGLNDNNTIDNRQPVNEGDSITFGIDIEDPDNDIVNGQLFYRLRRVTSSNLVANGENDGDGRFTSLNGTLPDFVAITGTPGVDKRISISLPTLNSYFAEDPYGFGVEVLWSPMTGNVSDAVLVDTAWFTLNDLDKDTHDHNVGDTFEINTLPFRVDEGETRVYSGSLTGSNPIVKTGNGTLVLNGNNVHTGRLDIQAGCVELRDPRALGTPPATLVNNHINIMRQACLISNNANGKISAHQNIGFTIGDGSATESSVIESNNGTLDILGPITRTNEDDVLEIRTNPNSGTGTVRIRSRLDQNNLENHNFTIMVRNRSTLDLNDPVAPFNNVMHAGNIMSEGDVRGKGKISGDVIFDGNGRFLPGAELNTTMIIGGNLNLTPRNETYISIRRDGNDAVIVEGDVVLDGRLLLIPFEDNLPSGQMNLITLVNSPENIANGVPQANQLTNNGWNNDTIINYRDNRPFNGISLTNDTEYPVVEVTVGDFTTDPANPVYGSVVLRTS